MSKIIIIGAGGHARSCLNIIENQKKYKIAGFVDKEKKFFYNYPYLGNDDSLEHLSKKYKNAIISIGQIKDSKPRKKIYEKLKKLKFNLPKIISSNSIISKYSIIDEATFIFNHVLVNTNAKIGKNSIINNKVNIEHDVIIGDNCHISTGVIVNGNVTVGNNVFIGSGSIIYNNCKIGNNSIISAGSIIKKNIPNNKIIK